VFSHHDGIPINAAAVQEAFMAVTSKGRRMHRAPPGAGATPRFLRGRTTGSAREPVHGASDETDHRPVPPEVEAQRQHLFAQEEEVRSRADAQGPATPAAQPRLNAASASGSGLRRSRRSSAASAAGPEAAGTRGKAFNQGNGK
jgi:hypothetical protein